MTPLVNKVDFQRLLASRPCGRSAHFALHHVNGRPADTRPQRYQTSEDKLSTDRSGMHQQAVDDLMGNGGFWFGCVVPKRHARRSVTRSLLKRQMRGALGRHAEALGPGLWLLRLRQGFPVAQFPSAASSPLAAAARGELETLLLKAAA